MVVGIDPGAEGGIVALSLTKAVILACPLPWKPGHGLDLAATCIRLETLRDVARDSGGRCLVIVEKQLYMARDGGKGVFTTGRNFGRLEGLLEAVGMEFATPEPNKHGKGWQSILGSGEGDTKARARELVARELPDLELLWGRRTVPHQGLADAGAIALWGLEAVQKGLDILEE
jgi:hypothetical protein